LARIEGTASACLAAVREGRAGSEADRLFARDADPAALEAAIANCGARIAPPGSDEYPNELGDLADPPAAIFVRGSPLTGGDIRVAVVGARNCSALGRDVAQRIGNGLAVWGVTVVSGAARGIDTASHDGALFGRGRTIAVLGSGIDVAYPLRNRKLLDRIASEGTIVSEYAPGVPAEPFRFPARNRLIAALSRAIVIVEGGERSGSLITTEHALDLGRSVFAVPGSVTNPLAAAPLGLIRDGATMIRGSADLLEDLGITGTGDSAGSERPPGLSLPEEAALDALTGPTLPEAVAKAMNCDLSVALSVLLQLELKGVVRNIAGRFEARPGA
jgi:DNA processing protein